MTTATLGKRYLSVAETAKMVRAALKREFPGQKFSVRSHSYSGGAAIRVHWTDGPRASDVQAVTSMFEGARFDGMIDLAYGASHWLDADGVPVLAETYGHGMGMDGVHAAPTEGAVLVHFGADYVTETRELSDAYKAVLKAAGQDVLDHAHGFEGLTMDGGYFGQSTIPTRYGSGACLWADNPETLIRALSAYIAPDGTEYPDADR